MQTNKEEFIAEIRDTIVCPTFSTIPEVFESIK